MTFNSKGNNKQTINNPMLKTKLNILYTTILIAGLILAAACDGPTGPQGPQGEQGTAGPIGPAGEDGTIIHAGEGMPDETIGENGDFYLNLSTGDLYGPKDQNDGWGSPLPLQGQEGPQGPPGEDGQDGADGKDGSKIYTGNGSPDVSLGVEGDFYLDTDNFDLYGPKTSSSWGTPINLQGPVGPQGPEGPQGPQGPEGPQGPQGPAGDDGEDGADGEDGEDGNANVTLYEFAGHDFSVVAEVELRIGLNNESEMLQSAWHVYLLHGSGYVYHIPGPGHVARTNYQVRHLWDGSTDEAQFEIISTIGLISDVYSDIHIIRVEANNSVAGKQVADYPDMSDYHAVVEYFGLK